VLSRPAEPVADPTAPEIARLVDDMLETMDDIGGRGIAAPQVHVAKRVFIFHVPNDEAEAESGEWSGLEALVNPTVEPLGGERIEGWESCLSLPGLRGWVERFARVRYRGTTPGGEAVERTVEGRVARTVQHEFDHLDGILYPMRMDDLSLLVFTEEAQNNGLPSLGEDPDESEEPEIEAAE
jgi:peptide deformylase